MDIRYSANQKDFKRYTTEELRQEFLITDLYKKDEIVSVYSHVDRMVTFGCMPVDGKVALDKGIDSMKSFGTSYILERREIGVFNIGGDGSVEVDGKNYDLGYKDCIYITKETKEVYFSSKNKENPAKFYMVSAPAHKVCKTTLLTIEDANKRRLGDDKNGNKRTINQFIHPEVLETCQLSMGLTSLDEGNVWNSMPPHTHERRMEIYTYFELEDNIVMHFMGEPTETRNVVIKNEEAIISPSWSIHCGAGTKNYSFIWAMGGENQTFDDMDNLDVTELK